MKYLVYSIISTIMLLSCSNVMACDWIRYKQSYPVVSSVVPYTYVVPAPQPSTVYVPVVVYQPVAIQPVPVVEQRVVWVWPNYYQYPIYTRPTLIRY